MGWKSALLKREISASLMRGQFPAPQHLQMGFGRGLPFWDLDGWSFPSMQHRTGNLQGCNSPFIHFPFPRAEKLGLPTTDSLSPWVKSLEVTEPFYLLHACRYKRETINHHSKHREGGKVHSLCWPGLQIKGNLVMRTHQMIINKQSFLCLIYLPRVETFPRDRKGCSAGTWSVGLSKGHQFN